jgi:hypothetical protein
MAHEILEISMFTDLCIERCSNTVYTAIVAATPKSVILSNEFTIGGTEPFLVRLFCTKFTHHMARTICRGHSSVVQFSKRSI